MHHHNTKIRANQYLNPLTGKKKNIDGGELLRDYDSTAEITILKDYIDKFASEPSDDKALGLSRYITDQLNEYSGKEKYLSQLRK